MIADIMSPSATPWRLVYSKPDGAEHVGHYETRTEAVEAARMFYRQGYTESSLFKREQDGEYSPKPLPVVLSEEIWMIVTLDEVIAEFELCRDAKDKAVKLAHDKRRRPEFIRAAEQLYEYRHYGQSLYWVGTRDALKSEGWEDIIEEWEARED